VTLIQTKNAPHTVRDSIGSGAQIVPVRPPCLEKAQVGAGQSVDRLSWLHLTDKPPAPEFVAYWTNNGQKAALGLDLSAAIDPKATWNRWK
jgi:hypothetical protein